MLADWNPNQAPAAVLKANLCLNRAIQQVAVDAPHYWFTGTYRFRALEDVEPTMATDTLQVETDESVGIVGDDSGVPSTVGNPWVFRVTLAHQAAGAVVWRNDRTWDTRYIDITDENGVIRTNRIRTIWIDDDVVRFTVWTPWNINEWGTGPFETWRVYTPEYFIWDDMIELRSLMVLHEDTPKPIRILGEDEAESYGLGEYRSTVDSSFPQVAFSRRHEQLQGPRTAPIVSADGEWRGPDVIGSFQYMTTWCWGKRSSDYQSPGPGAWDGSAEPFSQGHPVTGVMNPTGVTGHKDYYDARFLEPIFESAPSPASSVIANGTAADLVSKTGIKVQPASAEHALGFQMQGELFTGGADHGWGRAHTGRSGWYNRIYRKRISHTLGVDFSRTETSGGGINLHLNADLNPDYDDNYYLLAETKWDGLVGEEFVDVGTGFPDMHRPLRSIHGYRGLRLHPRPDEGFEYEIRGIKRPRVLVSDQDVPSVSPEACDLILYKALEYWYEMLKDNESGRMMSMNKYQDLLLQASKRHSTLVPAGQPVRRRPVRYTTANNWRNK
jgi:hypothetical protein